MSSGSNVYKVEGIPDLQTDLQRNVTRLGVAEATVSKRCGDIELTFIAFRSRQYGFSEFWRPDYGNSPEGQMREYLDLVCDSIKWFESLFGFWPGGSRFWVSNRPLEGDSLHSLVGFTRWMQPVHRERLTFVPHHVLHAWIWFTQDAPIRLEAAESEWIQEGVPTFYEFELAAQLTGDDIGSRRQHFSRPELVSAISEVAGKDMTAFYDRHYARVVSKELPPVGDVIADYREPFRRWVDQFISVPGSGARGMRALFFVALEIGLQSDTSPYSPDSEHFVATGSGIYNLEPFRARLSSLGRAITEQDVSRALSAITGVDQSDFFDFYTVGDYRPSVKEIQEWLGLFTAAPGQATSPPVASPQPGAETPQPTPTPTQPVAAYLSPSTIQIGVPTEVEIIIRDGRLVSGEVTTRIAVVARTGKLLGRMLTGTRGHYSVRNLEYQSVTTSFEVGFVPLQRMEEGWKGKVTLTLPDDLRQIQLRATEESTYTRELAVTLVAPAVAPAVGPAEGPGSSAAETGKTGGPAAGEAAAEPKAGASSEAAFLAVALVGVLAAAGVGLSLRFRKSRR